MKHLIISAAIAVTSLAAFAQQPAPAAKPQPKIAATINGEVLTVDDVNRMYANLNPRMRESYDQNGGKEAFVEQYLRKRLLVQEAIKNNFDKDPEVAALLRDAREAAMFDLYVRRVVASEIIPESDMRAWYESHKEQYRVPEMMKARHIVGTPMAEKVVFNTSKDNAKSEEEAKRKIENIMKTLTPENFAEMAMRFSEDASAPTGGDLGSFERGKMVKEFDDVAFATQPGHISPMFHTQFGWHVLLVESLQPAGYKPYEEVKHEIRERLLSERADKVLSEVNALTMELMGHGQTKIYRENLK
jgi:peptidyl-prolyl cis-trans isomerase C